LLRNESGRDDADSGGSESRMSKRDRKRYRKARVQAAAAWLPQGPDKLKGWAVIAVFACILGIPLSIGFWNDAQPYEPSEEEVSGRPEMVVLDRVSVSIDKTYFGVANINQWPLGGSIYANSNPLPGDPMHSEVPPRVGVRLDPNRGRYYNVLLQRIPTRLHWKRDLVSFDLFSQAPPTLVVDNATEDSVTITADGTQLPVLDPQSHALIRLEADRLQRLTIRGSDSQETVVNLFPTQRDRGFTGHGIDYYVYNYRGANFYTVRYVRYEPED